MNNIFTLNHYKIEFERKEYRLNWNCDNCKYICIINIYNENNILVLKLLLNEIDILNICEAIFNYLEFNSYSNTVPLSYRSSDMCSYSFNTDFLNNNTIIIIKEFNPVFGRIIDRIKFDLNDSDYSMLSILKVLYEYFLYDFPEYSYIANYLY